MPKSSIAICTPMACTALSLAVLSSKKWIPPFPDAQKAGYAGFILMVLQCCSRPAALLPGYTATANNLS